MNHYPTNVKEKLNSIIMHMSDQWEIVMIAKKRKTLAVCKDCHHKIHHP